MNTQTNNSCLPPVKTNESGSILLPTLVLMFTTSVCVTSYLQLASHDTRMTREFINYKRSMAAAEAGLDKAILSLRNKVIEEVSPSQWQLNAIQPPEITGFEFESPNGNSAFNIMLDGDYHEEATITEGRWAGLIGDFQKYKVRVGVTGPGGKGVVLEHGLQQLSIPVFQFGVFYENDLEILPGPSMVFAGPVHTNDSLYVGCNRSLTFDDRITVKSDVFRHRKDRSSFPGGTVYIQDGNGNYRSMQGAGGYIDHDDPEWPVEALERWDGRFIDSSHGVPYLSLPIPHENEPHEIIQRANPEESQTLEQNKFENKADVKIWRDADGELHAELADGTGIPIEFTTQQTTTQEITYTTEIGPHHSGDNVIKFEDAEVGLGEDGSRDFDEFTFEVSGAGDGVQVETKASTQSTSVYLTGPGTEDVDALGFRIEYVSKNDDNYTLRVGNENAQHALSHVTFKFGTDGEVESPGNGSDTITRTTVIAGESKQIATNGTFADWREGGGAPRTMHSLDISVEALQEHPDLDHLNQICVYAYNDYQTDDESMPVCRLVEGEQLPPEGLTVATRDPIYIKGDYNTTGAREPSLVAGDAVSILSNNWEDSRSFPEYDDNGNIENSNWHSRDATDTTVNTIIMTGNTDTTTGQYNGGLENVLRFCESWSGRTLSFNGSILCMWSSQVATGDWQYGRPIYEAPRRDWAYDEMYRDASNAPPGIPHVYGLETLTWEQSTWTESELE